MPPAKKRECNIILFDVNSGVEYKRRAIKAYSDICARKFFQGKEDFTQLILVNTARTENTGNDDFPDKYEHIIQATEMVIHDPRNKRHIEEAEPGEGNWLEAVLLATDLLERKSKERGIYSLQLLLFSDLQTSFQTSNEALENMLEYIISKINDLHVFLYILGPEVEIPSTLRSKSDVHKWTQNLQFKVGSEENGNYKLAKRLIQECNGVMCGLEIGSDLFTYYKTSKNRQPWLVPLTFDTLQLPTATSKMIHPEPSYKPTPIKEGIPQKTYVDAEDETVIIIEEVVRGIAVYDKLVMIPHDIEKGMKDYERCFKLFGFTPAANVPNHYMMTGSINEVIVDVGRDPNAKALEYMIRATHNLNMYGIAMKVHMKNCKPKLFCLIPEVTETSVSFIMPEITYAEGINIPYQEGDLAAGTIPEDTSGLKDDVYGFLDGIDVTDKLKLHPHLKTNPCTNTLLEMLTEKLLGKEIEGSSDPNFGDLCVEQSGKCFERMFDRMPDVTEQEEDSE